MGIANMLSGDKIVLVPPQKRSPVGNRVNDKAEAKARGARSNPWKLLAPNWWGNAGISRPYVQFIAGEPYNTYQKMLSFYGKGDVKSILELEESSLGATRAHLKGIFGAESTVMFDANGSCLISTLSKCARGKTQDFETITFTDQGRLVYAALGFEARSIIEFRQNFEQQLGIFDHPYPNAKLVADEGLRPNVHVVDIFTEGRKQKSDGRVLEEFEQALKRNRKIGMVLLLHVSRTGRVLPVEEMAAIAKRAREDIPVFVDGCQAVGRVASDEMKKAFLATDGYILVGHKALGAMIGAAAVLKNGVEEKLIDAVEAGALAYPKLFQFEGERMNRAVRLHAQGRAYQCMVSAPEAISLRLALEACERDCGKNMPLMRAANAELTYFFSGFPQIRMLSDGNHHVPDIVPFVFEPPKLANMVKDALKNSDPPITVAPITHIGAMRVAIDPKLPGFERAIGALKEKFEDAMRSLA